MGHGWRDMGRRWTLLAVLVAIAAVVGALVVPASLAATCDETWANTSTSGDWNTASNWSPASIPTGSQNVCLPAGSYTVTITGATASTSSFTVGSGVTLEVIATSSSGSAVTTGAGTSVNSGTIELTDNASTSSTQKAEVLLNNGGNLTNDGTILSDPGGGFGTRTIDMQQSSSTVNNASGGTITVNYDLQIDNGSQSGLFETSGNVTIASGKKFLVDPNGALLGATETAEMDIGGGTITDDGTFGLGVTEAGGIGGSSALKVNGGTITGTSAGTGLLAISGASNDTTGTGVGASFSGTGTGAYTFLGSLSANQTTLGGTIGANQTVVLSANKTDGNPLINIASPLTNDGTIKLTDSDASSGGTAEDRILINTGQTLTNDGTIVSDPGPGGQGTRAIDGQGNNSGTLLNAADGTIAVNAPLLVDQSQAGVFTNQGTINVASGQTLFYAPDGGFVSAGDTPTFNLEGGTITDTGNFDIAINPAGNPGPGPTVNVTGGTVSGNPIFASQPEINFNGAGSGAFTLLAASSVFNGSILSGTIGSNDQVTVDARGVGSFGGGAVLNVNSNVTNDGTVTVTDSDSSGSSTNQAALEIGSGDTLTNHGTIDFTGGPGSLGTRSVSGTVSNASDGTIDANFPVAVGPSQPSLLTNAGSVNVAAGKTLDLSSVYTQNSGTTNLGGSGATINVTGTDLNGGQLTGAGTIQGDLTNGATIAPSPSPSTISVTGTYTQSSAGTLAVGVTSSGSDKLSASGTAALNGTLQVSTANGFTPTTGQQFQVLTGSSVSGTFASTTGLGSGPYTVAYNPTNVTLTAAASTPGVSFNPSSMTFGSASSTVAAGSTVHQTLTITDSGTASLTIGTLSLAGANASSFSLSSDQCSGQTIAAGASCTVSVGFSPAAGGSYSAAVNVPDNASGSPQQVPLSGTAGSAGARASVSPGSIGFGPVGVGAASAPRTLTVTSTGSGPLNVSSVGLAGTNAADYKITSDSCSGKSLAPGSSCTTSVSVTAGGGGSRTAALVYNDNAPDSPQSAALSATGSTTGTLAGFVVNGAVSGNPPLPGANVTACQYGPHGQCESANTAADGSYSISGLAPGAWQIQVEPSQSYLFAAGSVLTIVAGLNVHNYTLTPPAGLSSGFSVNGLTGGVANTYYTGPATVQAPFVLPTSGPAGRLGITVIAFRGEPLTDTGGGPYAEGSVAIVYQFDSSGAPKFVAMDNQPFPATAGPGPAIGTFTTSALAAGGSVPVAGQSVAGFSAQGVFTPPPGGPDYHGAFLYEIHQWSQFTSASAAAGDRAGPVARSAQANGSTGLLEAERCLHGTNSGAFQPGCDPNPPPPPPGGCPAGNSPLFIYLNQSGTSRGIFDLGNGTVWNAATNTLDFGPNGPQFVLGGGTVTLFQPSGNPLGSNLSAGATASGVTVNADGSVSYDGFTFYPNGTVLAAGGQKYDPQGEQISGPTPDDNCKPKNNYWHDVFGWQDPSGSVMTTTHIPVPAATVVLTRSGRHSGPFAAVPSGSLFMAPNNRRNPDHTTALGLFGWDVVPGFYRVSARHSGCKAAGGGASVFSPILTIPPAVTGIKLKLRCPHLKRGRSRTKLTAKKVPVGEVGLIAFVRGRHPQGIVTFKRGGRTLGVLTLTHAGRALLTTKGTSTHGFRAIYSGDGYNAPSSGGG